LESGVQPPPQTRSLQSSRIWTAAIMNDPGLDEPISNDAKHVENQEKDEREEKEEDEQAFLEPR
jgi:hypothetical protein